MRHGAHIFENKLQYVWGKGFGGIAQLARLKVTWPIVTHRFRTLLLIYTVGWRVGGQACLTCPLFLSVGR